MNWFTRLRGDNVLSNKVPCTHCGVTILPATAARTGGLCMPCSRPALPPVVPEPPPSLSLAQYVAPLADVPLPTQPQKESFADYVSHAHSWYKHLPLFPPGAPFYFFVDKYIACDRVLLEDGTPALVERTKKGFQDSAIPTEEYRTHHGYLSCKLGDSPLVDKFAVPGDDARMYGLPSEILEVGVVPLTAVIHTLRAAFPVGYVRDRHPDPIDWPRESGGQVALEKLLERGRKMREPSFKEERMMIAGFFVDPILRELLEPEQRRQQAEIVKAVDRVCEVIDTERKRILGITVP